MKKKYSDIGRCLVCVKNPCQCKEQNRICAKCGEEYMSYRDGYCEDCEADDDVKSLEDRLNI